MCQIVYVFYQMVFHQATRDVIIKDTRILRGRGLDLRGRGLDLRGRGRTSGGGAWSLTVL